MGSSCGQQGSGCHSLPCTRWKAMPACGLPGGTCIRSSQSSCQRHSSSSSVSVSRPPRGALTAPPDQLDGGQQLPQRDRAAGHVLAVVARVVPAPGDVEAARARPAQPLGRPARRATLRSPGCPVEPARRRARRAAAVRRDRGRARSGGCAARRVKSVPYPVTYRGPAHRGGSLQFGKLEGSKGSIPTAGFVNTVAPRWRDPVPAVRSGGRRNLRGPHHRGGTRCPGSS